MGKVLMQNIVEFQKNLPPTICGFVLGLEGFRN